MLSQDSVFVPSLRRYSSSSRLPAVRIAVDIYTLLSFGSQHTTIFCAIQRDLTRLHGGLSAACRGPCFPFIFSNDPRNVTRMVEQ
jgi:hypothetical protein